MSNPDNKLPPLNPAASSFTPTSTGSSSLNNNATPFAPKPVLPPVGSAPRPPMPAGLTESNIGTANIDSVALANESALDNILLDAEKILVAINKSEEAIDALKTKLDAEVAKNKELSDKVTSQEQVVNDAKKKIADLQAQAIGSGKGSAEVKQQLAAAQEKLRKYVLASSRSADKIAKIKAKIGQITTKVSDQIKKYEVDAVAPAGAQVGSGPRKSPKQLRKKLGYFKVIQSLQGESRKKLDTAARKLGLNPSSYRSKEDVFVAISLVLHAKYGNIRRTRDIKVISNNLGIKSAKNKEQLCKELKKKLRGVSLKKL